MLIDIVRSNASCIESLITPPFYWGINVATGGFAGSFTVKPETMISVLCDILECLKKWGFENIFLLNFHGDLKHNVTILESVRKAYEELGIGSYFVVPEFFLRRAGISEVKPYMIIQPEKPRNGVEEARQQEYIDIHAGGFETSMMVKDFPGLVDIELARTLGSSRTTWEGLKVWQQGEEKAREITPLGYCGNPSDICIDAAKAFENEIAETIPGAISDFLKQAHT